MTSCRRGARMLAASLLLAAGAAWSCAPAGRAPASPPGLALEWTPSACAAPAADADGDGLGDACETGLARAFAPLLRIDRRDCSWMAGEAEPRLGGGYLFAAQPVEGGVRLAYLPAYYRDCGWSGPVCRLRGPRCTAHAGDSEVVLVDVAPGADGRWTTTGVFLSAHCFGRSAGRCRWYRGRALDAFAWADGRARGAPVVWVARGKHANYPSRASCDRGHWLQDTCDRNDARARFPVLSARQNVGSRLRPAPAPGGCVAAEALPLGARGADAGTRECIWSPTSAFRGWQAVPDGADPTGYARYLHHVAGF